MARGDSGNSVLKIIFKPIALVLMSVALFSAASLSQDASAPATINTNVEIKNRLATTLTSVQLKDVTLQGAIEALGKLGGVDFKVNWDALASDGFSATRPVQADLKNVKLGVALNRIFSDGSGSTNTLRYGIDDNAITISTKSSQPNSEELITKAYSLKSFCCPIPSISQPEVPSTLTPNMFGISKPQPECAATFENRLANDPYAILKTIEHSVVNAIGGRDEAGANGCSISVLRGYLYATQPAEKHAIIENYLEQLSRKHKIGLTVRAKWVEMEQSKIDELNKLAKEQGSLLPKATDEVLTQLGAKTVGSGQIAIVSGQKTYIFGGKVEYYVASLEPVLGEISLLYPMVRAICWGPMLDVNATAAPDGKSAIVSLSNVVTKKKAMNAKTGSQPASFTTTSSTMQSIADYKLATFDTLQFSTTLDLPLDTPVLVGGMNCPLVENGNSLCLILEVSGEKDPMPASVATNGLDMTITSLNLKDVTLDQAIDELRKISGMNFHIEWNTLSSSGCQRDIKFSVNVSNKKLSDVISKVLRCYGDGLATNNRPEYFLEDGIVVVSAASAKTREDRLVMRVYNATAILESIPNFPSPMSITSLENYGLVGKVSADDNHRFDMQSYYYPAEPKSDDILKDIITAISCKLGRTIDESDGNFQTWDGFIYFRQPPEYLPVIETEIKAAMKRHQNNVVIRAKWLEIEQAKIAQLTDQAKKNGQHLPEMSENAISQLGAKLIYSSQIVTSDEQQTFIFGGTSEYCNINPDSVWNSNSAGFYLSIHNLLWGPMLESRVVLEPGNKTAIVTLSSIVTGGNSVETTRVGFVDPKSQPQTTQPGTEIQLPQFDTQQFSTMTRVPLGIPVLVGGMTSPQAGKDKVLYLVLEVSAQKEPAQAD